MKVYYSHFSPLYQFEREVAEKLCHFDIEGYALVGFNYTKSGDKSSREIDVVLLTQTGFICCLEIKGYPGTWTGSLNTEWKANGQLIKSCRINPQAQVQEYKYLIQDKLVNQFFQNIEIKPWVNTLIVAPDHTSIEIEEAVINRLEKGKKICICQLSFLESALNDFIKVVDQSPITISTRKRFLELNLSAIVTSLVKLDPEQLEQKRFISNSSPVKALPVKEVVSVPVKKITLVEGSKQPIQKGWWWRSIAALALGSTIATLSYFSGLPKWDISATQTFYRKNLTTSPLIIGVMTDPTKYSQLDSYLERELSDQLGEKIVVEIDGDATIPYEEVKNKITQKEWDIVFAYSPMNGVTAEDSHYTWIAKMFPDFPSFYQAVLFVKKDSPIQDIHDQDTNDKNNINESTVVALGQNGSASRFYMPLYDLYGKTFILSKDHARSQKIIDLVRSGQAHVGAAAKSEITKERDLRIIHTSRDIPGSGVYLSPHLSLRDQKLITQLLLSAPATLQKEGNYGEGEKFNYQQFRDISKKVDELIQCVDLNKNPIQNYCL